MQPSGLYIHIPFCKSKCIYCDFFSTRSVVADWDALVSALLNEFISRHHELGLLPETLYVGGGTPSLMPDESFGKLIHGIDSISGMAGKWREFTIEVNPEDVTDEKARLWRECGVNRVSLGVQSFNDSELSAIKRNHDSLSALRAYNILRSVFSNISVDLMFGLPGQTVNSWESTVNTALSLNPEHISCYSLMFEEKTPLTILREKGRISLPSEEESLEMWESLTGMLARDGYSQYEISNYSRHGYESLHNRRYWLGNPYLGIGPSAHSYDGIATRRSNPIDIKAYVNYFNGYTSGCEERGESKKRQFFYKEEFLGKEELMEERIMLRLRMREGIDLQEFRRDFGNKALLRILSNSKKHVESGNMKLDDNFLSLTGKGIMISDDIILDLVC